MIVVESPTQNMKPFEFFADDDYTDALTLMSCTLLIFAVISSLLVKSRALSPTPARRDALASRMTSLSSISLIASVLGAERKNDGGAIQAK